MKFNYSLLLLLSLQLQAQLSPNQAGKLLDKNRVRARIHTVNNKFWTVFGSGNPGYEVPKGKNTHAQFCNSLWIGGYDRLGQLHVSANTYRQTGTDFWPGPLDTANIAAFNVTTSTVYNKLWKIDCNDINNFVTAYNSGMVSAGNYTVPSDISSYPAKGIGNFKRNMQPFYDANNNGVYNPAQEGDYPIIKGDQQILSIYNDYNSTHTETKGLPMGLEIYERSYSYYDPTLPDSMQVVNFTTFYRYTIINRSSENYSNVFVSDWSDVDLGNYSDDYIGTDSVNHFTYCYNADSLDENSTFTKGYGLKVPVVSHAILKTYCVDGIDNDLDGFVDEAGEQFLLNRSMYYNNNIGGALPQMINPDSAIHYYRYMSGYWKDGTALTDGGTGYGGFNPAKFVYPGNPVANSGWTEKSAMNMPGDRRIIFSSGPFSFPAGARIEWGYAVVFSQDTTQNVNTITQFNTRVQRDVRNVRYYDETHQTPQCAPAITLGFNERAASALLFSVWPNPSAGRFTVQLNAAPGEVQLRVRDLSGRLLREDNYNSPSVALDLSALDSGIYLLELQQGSNKAVKKIILNQ